MANAPVPLRIAALDLIRGIAVLGILAVNILGFAAPDSASYSPNLPRPGSVADNLAFAAILVLFEGKMRALFTLLFGASLLLFVERARDQRRDGVRLQLRRLGWLALFGYLHFVLLWDGDILFLYAVVGLAALPFARAQPLPLAVAGLILFAFWQGAGGALMARSVGIEAAVRAGTATTSAIAEHREVDSQLRQIDRQRTVEARLGLLDQARSRLADRPDQPLILVVANFGETFPLMLLGMALLKSGFFAAGWTRRRLWHLALAGTGIGVGATLAFAAWALRHGFPEIAMQQAIHFLLGFPHLLMALGYAAVLVLAAPALLRTGLGARLEAVGRMAFSNYIATSAVMGAVFSGWGLDLFGRFGTARMWLFVPPVWVLMLIWSRPWLARFRHGPLEWAWRSLTEHRAVRFRL